MIDYGPSGLDRRWWLAEEGQEHERLMAVARRLRMQDSDRREKVLRHLRMYGSYARKSTFGSAPDLPPDRLRYNVCSEGVDTLVAEITSNKPKASILTTGGDWTLRQAAHQRELVVEGQMRASGVWASLSRDCQRDAETAGDGFAEVYVDWETLTPKVERVLHFEILVDEADARYGKPRQIIREMLLDRGVLKQRHARDNPALARKIDEAPRYTGNDGAGWVLEDVQESDLIRIVKAWHLPSSPSADDGRFVVAMEGVTLYSGPHKLDRFPIIHLKWAEAPFGYYGIGVVAQLEADQIELNRTLRRIQEAAGVAAGAWLLERGARVRQAHLTDVPGACIEYTGIKPEYLTPGTVPTDLVMHADRIIARALARLGISQMMANATKPAGLNSGEAQRVHADVFSRRQIEHVQNYETFHVDIARAFVDANEQIAAYLQSDKKSDRKMPDVPVEVQRGRRKVLKRLRFDEANLPENAWVMQAYPSSSLPSDPSGRQATISEWMQGGLIDPTSAKAMLQIPDTESGIQLQLADYDFALWAYETMVEDGEYVSPEPFQKLDLALELVRVSYLRGVIDGVPESRLDLVRNHMSAIKRLIAKAKAEAMKEAAPVTPPMAPPVDPALDAGAPPELAPELAGMPANTLPVAA